MKTTAQHTILQLPWTDQQKLEYAHGRFEKIYPRYPAIAQMWLEEIARLEKKMSANNSNFQLTDK
jgi:hypothetical protein